MLGTAQEYLAELNSILTRAKDDSQKNDYTLLISNSTKYGKPNIKEWKNAITAIENKIPAGETVVLVLNKNIGEGNREEILAKFVNDVTATIKRTETPSQSTPVSQSNETKKKTTKRAQEEAATQAREEEARQAAAANARKAAQRAAAANARKAAEEEETAALQNRLLTLELPNVPTGRPVSKKPTSSSKRSKDSDTTAAPTVVSSETPSSSKKTKDIDPSAYTKLMTNLLPNGKSWNGETDIRAFYAGLFLSNDEAEFPSTLHEVHAGIARLLRLYARSKDGTVAKAIRFLTRSPTKKLADVFVSNEDQLDIINTYFFGTGPEQENMHEFIRNQFCTLETGAELGPFIQNMGDGASNDDKSLITRPGATVEEWPAIVYIYSRMLWGFRRIPWVDIADKTITFIMHEKTEKATKEMLTAYPSYIMNSYAMGYKEDGTNSTIVNLRVMLSSFALFNNDNWENSTSDGLVYPYRDRDSVYSVLMQEKTNDLDHDISVLAKLVTFMCVEKSHQMAKHMLVGDMYWDYARGLDVTIQYSSVMPAGENVDYNIDHLLKWHLPFFGMDEMVVNTYRADQILMYNTYHEHDVLFQNSEKKWGNHKVTLTDAFAIVIKSTGKENNEILQLATEEGTITEAFNTIIKDTGTVAPWMWFNTHSASETPSKNLVLATCLQYGMGHPNYEPLENDVWSTLVTKMGLQAFYSMLFRRAADVASTIRNENIFRHSWTKRNDFKGSFFQENNLVTDTLYGNLMQRILFDVKHYGTDADQRLWCNAIMFGTDIQYDSMQKMITQETFTAIVPSSSDNLFIFKNTDDILLKDIPALAVFNDTEFFKDYADTPLSAWDKDDVLTILWGKEIPSPKTVRQQWSVAKHDCAARVKTAAGLIAKYSGGDEKTRQQIINAATYMGKQGYPETTYSQLEQTGSAFDPSFPAHENGFAAILTEMANDLIACQRALDRDEDTRTLQRVARDLDKSIDEVQYLESTLSIPMIETTKVYARIIAFYLQSIRKATDDNRTEIHEYMVKFKEHLKELQNTNKRDDISKYISEQTLVLTEHIQRICHTDVSIDEETMEKARQLDRKRKTDTASVPISPSTPEPMEIDVPTKPDLLRVLNVYRFVTNNVTPIPERTKEIYNALVKNSELTETPAKTIVNAINSKNGIQKPMKHTILTEITKSMNKSDSTRKNSYLETIPQFRNLVQRDMKSATLTLDEMEHLVIMYNDWCLKSTHDDTSEYDTTSYEYVLKILIIGDAGVGKSSLVLRYAVR